MGNDKRGFTLIELVVVIAIITLFAGLSLANYGRFNEEKKLSDEVKRISAALYLARTKAVSADADPNECTNFKGYRISFNTSPPFSYSVERDCNDVYDPPILTRTLSSNITLALSPSTVFFKSLSGGTDLTSPLTITIENATISKTIYMVIQPSGTFSEGDTNIPAPTNAATPTSPPATVTPVPSDTPTPTPTIGY